MSSELANLFSSSLLTMVEGRGRAAVQPQPTQAPAATAGAAGWPTIRASSAAATPTGPARRAPAAAPWATTPPRPPPRCSPSGSRRFRAPRAAAWPAAGEDGNAAVAAVGAAELVLDLLVALLDPVAQPVQPHDLAELGLLGAARGGASQVGQQIPGGQLGQPLWVGGGHHQPVRPRWPPAAQHRVRGPPGLGVAVTEAAGDPPPLAGRPWATPAELAGRLDGGVGGLGRRPGALAGLERQHERHACATQRLDKPGVVAVEAVGHHRPERDLGLLGGLDELGGQLGLGPKPRVALTLLAKSRRLAWDSSGLPKWAVRTGVLFLGRVRAASGRCSRGPGGHGGAGPPGASTGDR